MFCALYFQENVGVSSLRVAKRSGNPEPREILNVKSGVYTLLASEK